MAKDDKTPGKKGADLSKFLPAGHTKVEELDKVRSLTPIYSFKDALEGGVEKGWNPVAGYLVSRRTIEIDKAAEDGQRDFFVVELEHPTMAITGNSMNRQIVQMKQGEEILVPCGGNIENIRMINAAARSKDAMPYVIFEVTGTLQTKPGVNPMYTVDTHLHRKVTKKRDVRHLLDFPQDPPQLSGPGLLSQTSTGHSYDNATGEVVS